MFVANVIKNQIEVTQTEPMTSGSSKVYLVQFNFSDEWKDLVRTAVFKAKEIVIDVILDSTNICLVPWEVLVDPGVPVFFGVYGTKGVDIKLPTIWAQTAVILEGVINGSQGQEPTPDIYDQIVSMLDGWEGTSEEVGRLATQVEEHLQRAERASAVAERAESTVVNYVLNPPKPMNGTWWFWNESAKRYEDTGHVAYLTPVFNLDVDTGILSVSLND